MPKRGEKRGLLDLAARNAEVAYQARFNENVAANYDALETLRVVLGLPRRAAADRVLRHLDDPGKRNRRLDGRVRRRPDEAVGVPEVPDSRQCARAAASGVSEGLRVASRTSTARRELQRLAADAPDARDPGARLALPQRLRRDARSRAAPVSQAPRERRAVSGSDPDRRRQGPAVVRLRGARRSSGSANLVAVGIAKKEELLFTRDREDAIALPTDSPALLLIQRIRDEAHRFAITFHRLSRTKRDLRSELDVIGGIGPRRRKALLTAFGSLAGVRRATREELMTVVGAKCADAVLAHFARAGLSA